MAGRIKALKHLNITVFGNVQGVFYREEAQRRAQELKISGFAKNMRNGTVRMSVEGESEELKSFVKWCWEGSDMSFVKNVRVYEGNLEGYEGFDVK